MISALRRALLATGLAVLAACQSQPGKESPAQTAHDAWITTEIKTKLLADPKTSALKITVETTNGVVDLKGFASASEARRTIEIARHVYGVKEVRNGIIIRQ